MVNRSNLYFFLLLQLFKEALDNMVDDKKEQLLNATELKIIFGHLPPIYVTHCNMLEELKQMVTRWNEECSIGNLILQYVSSSFPLNIMYQRNAYYESCVFTFFAFSLVKRFTKSVSAVHKFLRKHSRYAHQM